MRFDSFKPVLKCRFLRILYIKHIGIAFHTFDNHYSKSTSGLPMTWVIQVKGKTTMKGVEKLVRKKQKNKKTKPKIMRKIHGLMI